VRPHDYAGAKDARSFRLICQTEISAGKSEVAQEWRNQIDLRNAALRAVALALILD
jgi:hypothetical protein